MSLRLALPSVFVFAALALVAGSGCSSTGSATDAGPDVTTATDARADRGVPVTDAGSCRPGDVSSFKPGALVPPVPPQDVCSPTLVAEFYAKCLDETTADTMACQAFVMANGTCAKCLETNAGASAYGPVISAQGIVSVNIAGCIALVTGDKGPMGCAAKYQAADDCATQACEANCPIDENDPATFTAYENCLGQAAEGGCKAYQDALCKVDGSPIAQCTDHQSFKEYYDAIAPLFCSAGG
jgi:hypothetical protein